MQDGDFYKINITKTEYADIRARVIHRRYKTSEASTWTFKEWIKLWFIINRDIDKDEKRRKELKK